MDEDRDATLLSDISVKSYKCGRSVEVGMHTQKRKKISFVLTIPSGNDAARDDEGRTLLIPEMCVPQRVEDGHLAGDSTAIYKVIIRKRETYKMRGWRAARQFNVLNSPKHSRLPPI